MKSNHPLSRLEALSPEPRFGLSLLHNLTDCLPVTVSSQALSVDSPLDILIKNK